MVPWCLIASMDAGLEEHLAAPSDRLGLADGVGDRVEGVRAADLGRQDPRPHQVRDLAEKPEQGRDAPLARPVAEPESLDDPLAGDHEPGIDPQWLLREGPVD